MVWWNFDIGIIWPIADFEDVLAEIDFFLFYVRIRHGR
jgi:hypothetical protein